MPDPTTSAVAARSGDADVLLSVSGLNITYGLARAVVDLDLEVRSGECVALLGANGAGKSSTLGAISGLVPYRGTVTLDGQNLRGVRPHQIVQRGVVQVPEQRAIFPDLTVEENLAVAEWTRRPGAELDADRALVAERLPRLHDLRDRRAGSLSGGEQQMLVMGKALLMRPRLLLIDELSLGLAPRVVGDLFDVLRGIHAQGVAILLVEQFVHKALELADRVYVLEKGKLAASGPAEDFRRDRERLASSYLGGAGRAVGAPAAPAVPAASSAGGGGGSRTTTAGTRPKTKGARRSPAEKPSGARPRRAPKQ